MKPSLELRSHSKRKISNIWSFFLYIIWIWMIRSARTMIGNCLIVFLRGRGETNQLEFGTAIRNLSERLDYYLMFAFREKYQLKWRVSSNKKGWISSLVGEESARIGFFEEPIESELDLVRQCVVGKQGSVRNVSSNIQYDSTRSSFIQVTDSIQLKGSSDQSRIISIPLGMRIGISHIDQSKRDSTTKRKIDSLLGFFLSSNGTNKDRIRAIP
ncbi:hypothetical protein Lal_00043420 [Lupinus albus]|nr:hypothetical protein Lal_00043420 [Lupinus albus]